MKSTSLVLKSNLALSTKAEYQPINKKNKPKQNSFLKPKKTLVSQGPAKSPGAKIGSQTNLASSVWKELHLANLTDIKTEAYEILNGLLAILFPGMLGTLGMSGKSEKVYTAGLKSLYSKKLYGKIYTLLKFQNARPSPSFLQKGITNEDSKAQSKKILDSKKQALQVTQELIDKLDSIREILYLDIQAAYEGDPAAGSPHEVLITYPCLTAIATHRIAHELYLHQVPLLPRIFSEWAHSQTGIDIHPGARIGSSFFIDHGTGVVIGETAEIGAGVKIYQGVTLGALSFAKDQDGRLIKGIKRHPKIEDGVILYSGATILGGDTVIGHNSVIGGNCWVTSSVPPFTLVNAQHSRKKIKTLRPH